MDFQEFKCHTIKRKISIDDKFGKIFAFIDFANVDKWFEDDTGGLDNELLKSDERLSIDLEKLFIFSKCFSDQVRFYYGHDPRKNNSFKFLGKTKYVFGDNMVFTKQIQQIKHYLDESEINATTRKIQSDRGGNKYIVLPKCNFDVEICVDAIRLMDRYDTFCLFSSDADFISLIKYLKNNRKKIILIKGGHVQHLLKVNSDLVINAQDIKPYIAKIKQKSSI